MFEHLIKRMVRRSDEKNRTQSGGHFVPQKNFHQCDASVALASTRWALADKYKDCALSGNALKYYKKMCLRLGLGENISAAANRRKDDHTRQKPTFELLVDQPGDLSHQGPRHNNDFEDIDDIQILPMIGEILGDRAEYLPRSDPSTWHLEGKIDAGRRSAPLPGHRLELSAH